MDADLASLITGPASGAPRSLVVGAPRAPLEAFLRLPIEGEATLWDGACWGEAQVASRGVARRWELTDETPQLAAGRTVDPRLVDLARAASDYLASVEQRTSDGLLAPGPRCHGGLAFSPRAPREPWHGFAQASFTLPRLSYELDANGARLRLNLLPGEDAAPHLAALGRAREALGAAGSLPGHVSPATLAADDDAAYERLVEAALASIAQGQVEKLVVARALDVAPRAADPWTVVARLLAPSLVRFAFERDGAVFLGATPERLISLDGELLTTEALAGSIAAGEGADARLRASAKDRHEHQVVVDEIVRSLGPLCAELRAAPTPEIRPLRHLLHLLTPISGRLTRPQHVLELVAALHPTPAVCGLPRRPSASWLQEHEGLERGWYASPVGWFDATGRGSFAVALRSALLRGPRARVFVGAGVVQGSTAHAELRETALKARSMLDALEASA